MGGSFSTPGKAKKEEIEDKEKKEKDEKKEKEEKEEKEEEDEEDEEDEEEEEEEVKIPNLNENYKRTIEVDGEDVEFSGVYGHSLSDIFRRISFVESKLRAFHEVFELHAEDDYTEEKEIASVLETLGLLFASLARLKASAGEFNLFLKKGCRPPEIVQFLEDMGDDVWAEAKNAKNLWASLFPHLNKYELHAHVLVPFLKLAWYDYRTIIAIAEFKNDGLFLYQ